MVTLLQPRRFDPRKAAWVLAVLAGFYLYTSHRDKPPRLWRWSGETMGSTYTVQIVDAHLTEGRFAAIQAEVESILEGINNEMSTWLPRSTLSRFNASTSTEPFTVSASLASLLRTSLEISERSGGAFDVTYGPMFDLWGFGKSGPKHVPSDAAIAETQRSCGYSNLSISSSVSIRKAVPGLQVVLNAICPGYAADQIAESLIRKRFAHIYVDVGGETIAFGNNLHGQPWRVGIERPDFDQAVGTDIERIVPLSGHALATSGDYRNYFTNESGAVFSHIFDTRTGRPATSHVASVSVLAPSCALADALATTLFVIGPADGIPLLTNWPGTEAYFLMRSPTGGYTEVESGGFPSP